MSLSSKSSMSLSSKSSMSLSSKTSMSLSICIAVTPLWCFFSLFVFLLPPDPPSPSPTMSRLTHSPKQEWSPRQWVVCLLHSRKWNAKTEQADHPLWRQPSSGTDSIHHGRHDLEWWQKITALNAWTEHSRWSSSGWGQANAVCCHTSTL